MYNGDMDGVKCHMCGAVIPGWLIPEEVLKSERGRRNAERRKRPGGRGKLKFWKSHRPTGPFGYCRCWECRWGKTERLVETLVQQAKRSLKQIDTMPPRIWERWAILQDLELKMLESRPKSAVI